MKSLNILGLTKLLFKGTIGIFDSNTKKSTLVVSWVGVTFSLLILLSQISYLYYSICTYSGADLLFQTALFVQIILTTFLCIPTFFSNMYQNKDIQMFGSLPVTKYEISMARLNICIIRILPISVLPSIPAIIIGGITGTLSIIQIILGILLLFIASFIIISVLGLIIFLIFQLEKFVMWKGYITSIFSILVYILIVGLLVFIQTAVIPLLSRNDPEFMMQSVLVIEKMASRIFIVSVFTSLLESGYIGFVILGLILVVVLLHILNTALYSKAYVSLDTINNDSNIKINKEPLSNANIKVWLFRKEMWVLKDTPFFISQLIQGILIPPIATGITAFTGIVAVGIKSKETIYNSVSSFYYTDLAIIGLIVAMATVNVIIPTSISREGKYFYISKMIPVKYKDQFLAKYFLNIFISLISIVLSFSIVLIADIPCKNVTGILVMVVLLAVLINLLSTALDFLRPIIKWTSPQQALNGNPTVGNQMLIVMGILLIFSTLYYVLSLIGIPEYVKYVILFASICFSIAMAWIPINKKINRYYENINI